MKGREYTLTHIATHQNTQISELILIFKSNTAANMIHIFLYYHSTEFFLLENKLKINYWYHLLEYWLAKEKLVFFSEVSLGVVTTFHGGPQS